MTILVAVPNFSIPYISVTMKVLNALLQLTSTAMLRHDGGIFTVVIMTVVVNVYLRVQ